MTVWYCPICRRWFHTLAEADEHDCKEHPR